MRKLFTAIALAAVVGHVRSTNAAPLQAVPVPTNWAGTPALARLGDGRVLIVGGGPSGSSSAEIFDPAKRTWSAAASMKRTRAYHEAISLTNGKVLVVGGSAEAASNAEVYDAATNTWTDAGTTGSGPASTALLTDGRVAALVDTSPMRFQLFDPATNIWTTGPVPTRAHADPFLASLAGGGLLLMSMSGAERYEGSNWKLTSIPPELRRGTGTARLADGRVLIVGGGMNSKSGTPLLYDPTTDSWRLLDGLRRGGGATVTPIAGDRYLIAGGAVIDPSHVLDLEVFNPKTLAVTNLVTAAAYSEVVTAPLGDGRALMVDTRFSRAFVVDPPRGCSDASECTSGFCVDGFCCDTACNGRCEACDVAPNLGKCTGVNGVPHGAREACSTAWTPACRALTCDASRSRTDCVAPVFTPPCDCASDAECPTGHCVDGVCCNEACDGQCEACDLPGSRGVCVPVTGEPRGVRKGCPAAGRGICSVRGCDGKERRACAYANGPETVCGSICGDRVIRHCDGAGLCGLPGELVCPDTGCSMPSTEPSAPPRFFDAVLVVALGALIERARRARR